MIDTSSGDPTAGSRHRSPVVPVAVACEGVALLASVIANLLAVWADGPVAIGFAVLVPLILIGATYLFLFDRLPVAWKHRTEGWQAWWANLAAAALILVPVASASYWHQRQLLIDVATAAWIATLLPLAVDGLALRAALTLFRLAHQPVDEAASPATTNSDERQDDEEREEEQQPETPELPIVPGVSPEVVAAALGIVAKEPTIGRPNLRRALIAEGHDVTDYATKKLQLALPRVAS